MKEMGKKRIYRVTLPANFSFRHTVESHGWYDLTPFRYNSIDKELSYTFTSLNGKPESVSIKDGNGTLSLWVSGEVARPEVIKW